MKNKILFFCERFSSNNFSLTKLFVLIYTGNIIITLIPTGILHENPFQNIFFADSYSYYCEIWRRVGTLDLTQKYWLDYMSVNYSNTGYECRILLESYYPGAPIFSRLSFFLPFQISTLIHPFFGPLLIHFLAQLLLLLLIIKIFKIFEDSSRVKFCSILLFSNPSFVYPVFAFGTEKYQLIVLSVLFVLIDTENKTLETKRIVTIAFLVLYLMLLRENILWSLFFCLQYLGQYRKDSKKFMAILFLGFSSTLYFFQDKFATWNTPDFVTNLGSNRITDEEGALRKLFSKEFFSLVNRSIGADITVMFDNFTIFDVITILLVLVILNGFWLNIKNLNYSVLLFTCIFIGAFNSTLSAAFFHNIDTVTFFRLFIPSVWVAILVTSKTNTKNSRK
jgi:hypothetical protein